MTELEILKRAKLYIDKMANGKNPITDEEAGENDVINNVRVSRCLFYVSGVLDKVIANGGEVEGKAKKKDPFHIEAEQLAKFNYSQVPIALTEIAKRINELVDVSNMRKMTYSNLAELVMSHGFLEEYLSEDGKSHKRITDLGLESGISYDSRINAAGDSYDVIVYEKNAQRMVLQLLSEFLQK